jgi:hypothetical protein
VQELINMQMSRQHQHIDHEQWIGETGFTSPFLYVVSVLAVNPQKWRLLTLLCSGRQKYKTTVRQQSQT